MKRPRPPENGLEARSAGSGWLSHVHAVPVDILGIGGDGPSRPCQKVPCSTSGCVFSSNIINSMIRDDSSEATFARLETACQEIYRALERGTRMADHLHSLAHWNFTADPHLHHHMARREAMEELKQLNPELDDDDDLGLAMSGLTLNLPHDIIRVWHTTDIKIPRPRTAAKVEFVSQVSRWWPSLFDDELTLGFEEVTAQRIPKNHTIIQWTAQGSTIVRFDLLRPIGVSRGQVDVEWRVPLLGRYTQVKDVQYRRRDDETGFGEEEAQ